ncbi:hypothetical protein Tco_1248386 [Tanacetum coccineum]
MFILYFRRVVAKDLRLARVVNSLCQEITAIIEEMDLFVQELDTLVGRFVPEKTANFMKENQSKDTEKMIELQAVARVFQLMAREKKIFIEKLKRKVFF